MLTWCKVFIQSWLKGNYPTTECCWDAIQGGSHQHTKCTKHKEHVRLELLHKICKILAKSCLAIPYKTMIVSREPLLKIHLNFQVLPRIQQVSGGKSCSSTEDIRQLITLELQHHFWDGSMYHTNHLGPIYPSKPVHSWGAIETAFPKHFRILSAYLSTAATTRPPIAWFD